MLLKTKLESVSLPKALADLKHANQFLKVYALLSSALSILCVCLAFSLLFKGPKVIAIAPTGLPLSLEEKPSPGLEIESAIRKYVGLRYSWDAKTVKDRLYLAREFVHQAALKSFDSDLSEVVKFSVDRNVSQRGYTSEVAVDLAKQVARIRGDRVTTIQGLTAAGPLALSLQFESGPRTKVNPWGIYVVRERNE